MRFNPYIEVALAAIIWGSAGVFIKYLSLAPTTMTFFRTVVPFLILLIYFLIKKIKIFKGNTKLMLGASALNAIRMFFYFVAFTYTSIGNAVIMDYTWPIFAAVFGWLIIGEKISKRNVLLLLIAFSGIILIYINQEFNFSNMDFLGMSSMLLSAILFALSLIMFKKGLKTHSWQETVFYQNLVAPFIFLPFLFWNPLPSITQVGVTVAIYAPLIGLAGFGLFFKGMQQIKASTASLLAYLEVVSALIFALIFFRELLTWNMALGGVLIIGSTILLKKETHKSRIQT